MKYPDNFSELPPPIKEITLDDINNAIGYMTQVMLENPTRVAEIMAIGDKLITVGRTEEGLVVLIADNCHLAWVNEGVTH